MFSIPDWLDRAKARNGIPSDYKLALIAGISHSSLINYRKGKTMPDERITMRLCELSGDDPEHVVACIQSMRAANDESAELWARVARRLAGGANVLLMTSVALVLGATALGWTDEAAASLSQPATHGLYIMLIVALGRFVYRLARNARQRRPFSLSHVATVRIESAPRP